MFIPYGKFNGFMIPNLLAKSGILSPAEMLIWGRMAQYAGSDGDCWPSYRALAQELSLSETTVKKNIKKLIDKGFVYRESEAGKSSHFYFLRHAVFNSVHARATKFSGQENCPGKKIAWEPGREITPHPGKKIAHEENQEESQSDTQTHPPVFSVCVSPSENKKNGDKIPAEIIREIEELSKNAKNPQAYKAVLYKRYRQGEFISSLSSTERKDYKDEFAGKPDAYLKQLIEIGNKAAEIELSRRIKSQDRAGPSRLDVEP
jgi:hypothetical protein